jgi:hypothetical protein
MKRRKKQRSHTHPKRDLNNARVLELLKNNWTDGFKQNEII